MRHLPNESFRAVHLVTEPVSTALFKSLQVGTLQQLDANITSKKWHACNRELPTTGRFTSSANQAMKAKNANEVVLQARVDELLGGTHTAAFAEAGKWRPATFGIPALGGGSHYLTKNTTVVHLMPDFQELARVKSHFIIVKSYALAIGMEFLEPFIPLVTYAIPHPSRRVFVNDPPIRHHLDRIDEQYPIRVRNWERTSEVLRTQYSVNDLLAKYQVASAALIPQAPILPAIDPQVHAPISPAQPNIPHNQVTW